MSKIEVNPNSPGDLDGTKLNPLSKLSYYHLRLDIDKCPLTDTHITSFIAKAVIGKNQLVKWHFVHETSVTGKQHVHAFLGYRSKIPTKDTVRIRNWWTSNKTNATYQPLSFCIVKYPGNMYAYIEKEGGLNNEHSNLSPEDKKFLLAFGTRSGEIKDKKVLLLKNIKEKLNPEDDFQDFCFLYMKEYYKLFKAYPRYKIQFLQAGYKLGLLGDLDYFRSIGLDIYAHQVKDDYMTIKRQLECKTPPARPLCPGCEGCCDQHNCGIPINQIIRNSRKVRKQHFLDGEEFE